MPDPFILSLLWLALTTWVASLTWFVQIVVYPLFAKVGTAEYSEYHRFYTGNILYVVILPGFATFLLPVPLAIFGPAVPLWIDAANIVAGLVGLTITVALQIPRHARLDDGKNDRMIAELVRFNWLRTLSVTVHAGLAFLIVLAAA